MKFLAGTYFFVEQGLVKQPVPVCPLNEALQFRIAFENGPQHTDTVNYDPKRVYKYDAEFAAASLKTFSNC